MDVGTLSTQLHKECTLVTMVNRGGGIVGIKAGSIIYCLISHLLNPCKWSILITTQFSSASIKLISIHTNTHC